MRTDTAPPAVATVPPPANPQTPAPPAVGGGLKKVSFGGIKKKTESTKTDYPQLPDPGGEFAEIAARIIQREQEVKALESALETDKADLKERATPFWFQHLHGKLEIPSSLSVASPAGEVLVTYQNRYKELPDESPILPILGERTGQYFRQAFTLKIDGDKLPAEFAGEIIGELQSLFAKHGAEDAISVKETIKPNPDFHERRHRELTVDENFQLNQVIPIVGMVKTKGRR